MTSRDIENKIHSASRMTVQFQATQEQYAFLQEWAASIPAVYFLDICAVNVTKCSSEAIERDERKENLINYLRNLDKPQHAFSYLLALVEKVSDPQGKLSDAELEEQVLCDVAALRTFLKNARVIEADEFLVGYLRSLRGNPHELKRPNYLKFLEAANNRFRLQNTVSPIRSRKRAKEIRKVADELSILRQHPVVLLVLACLYGNISAKKVMKFKADAEAFNAENALADIMIISRFLPRKLEIEYYGRLGRSEYLRSEFITDDGGLQGIFRCFEARAVSFEEKDGAHQTRIDIGVNFEELLTDLASTRQHRPQEMGESTNRKPDEFQQVCELLLQAS